MESHPEVYCTGGPIISKGSNDFAKAVAISMSSSIGVGNANHRIPDFEGYAEMACFPMFKKEVFSKFGLYDESLVRNQDDEYCFRIRLNGGKIFISPKVKSSYYVRDSALKLFNQYYLYGKWRIPVLFKHKVPISYRQQVPALFFLIVLIIFLFAIFINEILIGFIIPALYLIILISFALSKIKKNKFSVIKNIPTAIFILHFSYAIGFLSGIIKLGMNKARIIF
jgi:GT2 family glycosyltransferase